jgi:predicted TIM-barrel fold metal-dependent hydrolase
MPVLDRTYAKPVTATIDEVLISSDSHVIEPEGLWKKALERDFGERAPAFGGRRGGDHPGAMEGPKRVSEMAADGVSAEVLYPTHGLRVLSVDDPKLEQACVRVYNDWIIDYCSAAPDRLIGLGLLSMYDVEVAIEEMERCRQAGLHGAIIWQVPPPELSFASDHYESFWAAAQEMEMPVNLHILSGHGYSARRDAPRNQGIDIARTSVNEKLIQAMDSLYDLIFAGVFERYPRLKLVMVENEIGWLPFLLEQWDYYFQRHAAQRETLSLQRLPSEYFHDQVYATFFNDGVGGRLLSWWGHDNAMWSNDYPHGNSTWGRSREMVARDMGDLPSDLRAKLVRENVANLYGFPIPTPLA